MNLPSYYITPGIDAKKVCDEARKLSFGGFLVVVHFHGSRESCAGMVHREYKDGEYVVTAPILAG